MADIAKDDIINAILIPQQNSMSYLFLSSCYLFNTVFFPVSYKPDAEEPITIPIKIFPMLNSADPKQTIITPIKMLIAGIHLLAIPIFLITAHKIPITNNTDTP